MTCLLPLSVSRTWIQREKYKGHTERYLRCWESLFLPRSEVSPLEIENTEKHLKVLLDRLEPQAKNIMALSKHHHALVGIEILFVLVEDHNPGLYLKAELIRQISDLGLYLRLTCLSEGADDEQNETQVYFMAENYHVSPEMITKALQKEPSRICIMGEPVPDWPNKSKPFISRRNSWKLTNTLAPAEEIPRHLEHFLPQLLSRAEAMATLKKRYHADIGMICTTTYYQEQACLLFTPEIMRDLNALMLDLVLDFYFLGGADNDASEKAKRLDKDCQNHFQVAFIVSHATKSKIISDILGLRPVQGRRKLKYGTGLKASQTNTEDKHWVFQSDLPAALAPEMKVAGLLQILKERSSAVQQIKRDYARQMGLSCWIAHPVTLHLTTEMLQDIAALACFLTLKIDFKGSDLLSEESNSAMFKAQDTTERTHHKQAKVYFVCFDNNNEPERFIRQIPLRPSTSQYIGQPMPYDPESCFQQNSWTLDSPLTNSNTVASQLKALLEQLEPHTEALLALQQQGDTEMGIHCLIEDLEEYTVSLTPEIVGALGQNGFYFNLELQ